MSILKILSITLYIPKYGTDKIWFEVDIPYPFPSYSSEKKAIVDLEVPRGTGLQYLESNFPNFEIKIIDEMKV